MIHGPQGSTPAVRAALAGLAERFVGASLTAYVPLKAVREFVEHQLPERVTLSQAAVAAQRESKYFSVYFKRKVGVSFTDWLHIVRLSRALLRFDDWELSITQIALDVGYQDLRTFERAFKRLIGSTPSAFRRRMAPESRQPLGDSRQTPLTRRILPSVIALNDLP